MSKPSVRLAYKFSFVASVKLFEMLKLVYVL